MANYSMTEGCAETPEWNAGTRRRLSRAISAKLSAPISGILKATPRPTDPAVNRIAFTGAPGAGKSTLIATFAKLRQGAGRRVAIVAIDPSSPKTGGAILGDRIRMDAIDPSGDIFYRSIASGEAQSGLCRNADGVLETIEEYGFEDVVVETVGVGQGEYAVRNLVGTVVVVLTPGSGDIIQAMKAGILEVADIYVVNKSDLPGAENLIRELKSVLGMSHQAGAASWAPPILKVSSIGQASGHEALCDALDAHGEWRRENIPASEMIRRRKTVQLLSVIDEKAKAWIAGEGAVSSEGPLSGDYRKLLASFDRGE